MQLAIGAVTDATHGVAPDAWRRMLTLFLDGLRPARDTTRAFKAAPVTIDDLDAVMHADARSR